MKSKEILINKINFDINVSTSNSFQNFEKFLLNTYESNLNLIIQKTIDQKNEIDGDIIIDEIVVDLKDFNLNDFYSRFSEQFFEQLNKLKFSYTSQDYDFLKFFLKKGYYPWWYESNPSFFKSRINRLTDTKTFDLNRKYFFRYLNQLNNNDFNIYLKNLLNDNYFLFEDFYKLLKEILSKNNQNIHFELSKKIFLYDYLFFFKSKPTINSLKNFLIKFSKQFSYHHNFIINELYKILFQNDNLKSVKSYNFLKKNIEIIIKSIDIHSSFHDKIFPKRLIYSNYFNDNLFSDLKSLSNFKIFFDEKYVTTIYKKHKDFDNYATYQLSDFIKSEKFFLYFLKKKYSLKESKILYGFKELLKTSKLITYLDKFSIQNNINNYHLLIFYKYLISSKKRIDLKILLTSFLKKIAKQNKLDFHYFLLNFKLNTDLSLLEKSLAKILLNLFNTELISEKQLFTISIQENDRWDKHKNIYKKGTIHKKKIDHLNKRGGIIYIDVDLKAFVPYEHLIKKDGSKLKPGEVAKFKVIDLNQEYDMIFMSHTVVFKQIDKKSIYGKTRLKNNFFDYLNEKKKNSLITNSSQKELRNLLFSIFKLFKDNIQFKKHFKSINDLYSFIDTQFELAYFQTDFNLLLKVINVFSDLLKTSTLTIIIKYFKSISKKESFNDLHLDFIEKSTYLILLKNSQISSIIYDELIVTKDLDKIILLITNKEKPEINKFEKLFYIPFIVKNLSEKTFESVIRLISKDINNDYFDIYKLLVKNLEYQKLREYESQIKFYTLKILIENKKQLNRTFFINEIFKSFFLVNVNLASSLKSKLKNEDSLFEISNYINKIDYRKESLNNVEFFQNHQSNIKNIFQLLTSSKTFAKSTFSSNNFDFLLNLKNEINKSNNDLIYHDYNYYDRIDDILSNSKNLIDFLELNLYDQELFYSFVELSISENFNNEFISSFDKLNKKFSIYEKLLFSIYNDFNIANLDKRAFVIILRSYVLKSLVSNQSKDFTYSEFYIGFLYYLFNNAQLNLRNLSKINSLFKKVYLKKLELIPENQVNIIFQDFLYTTNLFLEVNNFTGITKSQKESIYYKDLSYYFIAFNEAPFWLKAKEFNQSDAFQIFEKLILSKKAIDFNYLFFNKSFLKNITNYSKSSEYLFQSKLVNAIKDSIKKSKVSKFKNLYNSLEPVTKFDQFFESLNNKIVEDSFKFDTIIQTERFDIISYYLEFGSLELTFLYQSKNELYNEFIKLYKTEKLKIKKLIYNNANNKQSMDRLLSLFPDVKKDDFTEIIHPNLNNRLKLLKQVIKKSYKKDLFKEFKFKDDNHIFIYLSFLWSKSNFIIFDVDKIIIDLINNFFFKTNIKSDVFFNQIKKFSKKLNKTEKIFIDKIMFKYNLVYDPVVQEDFKKQNIKEEFKVRKTISSSEDIDSLFLNNAGLILLWPYMYMLCEKLGFLKNKEFINETFRQKAILLTQYIVQGNLEFHEEELILNKIIFGVEIDYLVDCSIELLEHEIEICKSLLKSVLLNWKKMENTSIQTFRDSFLIREGLLSNDKENYVLHVDKNPYDVLLSTLPWSITSVQTLFMKNKIIVNWI
tara:strand:- start:12710 stop:17437 length:4728 start_codon:yes stop_codon:yes gene_type:complete